MRSVACSVTTSCAARRSRSVAAEFEAGSFDAGTMLYRVPDPERFGVAELDADGRVVGFEEKPEHPKSDLIPIGVYFLRPDAFEVIEGLAPSGRGELEITDVLNHYIPSGRLFSRVYDGDWTDAGTVPSLLRAAEMAAADDAAGRLAPPTTPTRWLTRWTRRGRSATSWSPVAPGSSARASSATSWVAATGPGSRSSTSSPTRATRRTSRPSATIRSWPRGWPSSAATSPIRRVVRPLVESVDAVVNFAAESHVDRSILDPEAFLATGVIGVHVLLEACRVAPGRPRFLQVSTDEVYGHVETGHGGRGCPARAAVAVRRGQGGRGAARRGATW